MKRTLATSPLFIGSGGHNPQVSARSRFHDDIWDFSEENLNPALVRSAKRIRWAFATPEGSRFTDPAFQHLLQAFRQFLFALCWHPIDSKPLAASTILSMFGHTKRFVLHLLEYRNPVLRFKDVLPHHCEDYVAKLLSARFNVGYKYHCLSALEKLSIYSRVMQSGMVIDPLKGESVGNVVGWNIASLLETQTEIIPDEILRPLVQACIEYIDRFAPYLLDASEAIEEIRARHIPQDRSVRYLFEVRSKNYLSKHNPATYGLRSTKFEDGLCSVRDLNKELCYLQTAGFVLIAFATGTRISELLSLREDCCEVQTEPGQPDLVWLSSRVYKMQGVPEGRKAKWIGGPLCARAVEVLLRLTQKTRRHTKSRSLWVPIPTLILKPRDAGPLKGDTIRYRLDAFLTMLGLKDSTSMHTSEKGGNSQARVVRLVCRRRKR